VGEMTTKPPVSRLAASGSADDSESDQITKEHNDDDDESHIVTVDPSEDVTVEATEDVTSEASSHTPVPSPRPGTVGVSAGQRAPTLLGVPIQSLPLPGVTSSSNGDATRTIDYNEEITVLAQPAPADPLAALDEALDDRPSITDDDEEETKVEPAETAMKAAASIDDVSTALSAQANLEREKALRRSAPPPSMSDDLEFADPEADDEEESLDDELDDDDEVISAGGAIEEEEDDLDDGQNDGVATATFMKSPDSTGLSGLLNPRRPPTGGRDGFGSRLPTPYPPPQTTIPAPSTSPFASRLGPAPSGSPYARSTTGATTAIQVPPPSGKATTETEPSVWVQKMTAQLKIPAWMFVLWCGAVFILGFGVRPLFSSKSTATPTVIVAKPTGESAAPVTATPVVVPVQVGSAPVVAPEPTKTEPAGKVAGSEPIPSTQPIVTPTEPQNPDNPEAGLWRPAKKVAAAKPHKAATDGTEEAMLKPKPAVAKEPKEPKAATPAVAKEPPKEPKQPAAAKEPKPAAPAGKPKKAAKVWVDPFAN